MDNYCMWTSVPNEAAENDLVIEGAERHNLNFCVTGSGACKRAKSCGRRSRCAIALVPATQYAKGWLA